MAVVAHVFPSVDTALLTKLANLGASGDTLQVLLVASTSPAYTWNATSQGHIHVSNFLAGSGAGALTEVSGGSYSRQTLTTVSATTTGLVSTLTCANPSWANATISATYACFFDNTIGGTDATNQLLCYWDFGGTQATTSATFQLTISGSGLITWTAS